MGDTQKMLNILEELSKADYEKFLYLIGDLIPRGKLENISRVNMSMLLQEHYPDEVLDITARILQKIPRRDLSERFHLKPNDGKTTALTNQDASLPLVMDRQLMLLAGKIGKEWKTIGIQFLGIQSYKLEQIEEENNFSVQMRVFQMLKTWRTQEKKEATATKLHEILSQKDVPLSPEAISFLVEQE